MLPFVGVFLGKHVEAVWRLFGIHDEEDKSRYHNDFQTCGSGSRRNFESCSRTWSSKGRWIFGFCRTAPLSQLMMFKLVLAWRGLIADAALDWCWSLGHLCNSALCWELKNSGGRRDKDKWSESQASAASGKFTIPLFLFEWHYSIIRIWLSNAQFSTCNSIRPILRILTRSSHGLDFLKASAGL